jgi:hypothetical protein
MVIAIIVGSIVLLVVIAITCQAVIRGARGPALPKADRHRSPARMSPAAPAANSPKPSTSSGPALPIADTTAPSPTGPRLVLVEDSPEPPTHTESSAPAAASPAPSTPVSLPPPPVLSPQAAALVGYWEVNGADEDQRINFLADGTFTHAIVGAVTRDLQGKWTFDGATLVRNIANSPDGAQVLTCKVTALTDDKLTLDDTVTFIRL